MKCSRCAAELPDSSTFCSTCGAANPSSQLSTASFSYLPAGAPPWPASIPARSAYAPGSAVPAQMLPYRPAERSKRQIGGKVMASVLVLLIPLLLGVGGTLGILASQGRFSSSPTVTTKKVIAAATPAQTTQATPAPTTTAQGNQLPTPTSFKSISIKDVNAALEYPSNWVQDSLQKLSNGNSLAIHPPQTQQTGIGFFIMRFSASVSATISAPDEINQANIAQLSQTNSNTTNVQNVATTGGPPTIGGIAWTEQDASYVDGGSNKMDMKTISVVHNKIYYNILVISPDAYYTEAMQKYIQHMFTTFKFLS